MSNYINKRVLKIKELSEELTNLNLDIKKHISFLEAAKNDYHHQDNLSFDIVHSTKSFSIEEQTVSLISLYLLFKIKDQEIKIAFLEDFTDLFNKKISLDVLFKLSNILSFIEQKTSLLELYQKISKSNQIYCDIFKYQEEIKTKTSNFNVNSDFLISHLNSYLSKMNLEKLSNQKLYVSFKKVPIRKLIVLKEGTEKKHDFIIYLPNYNKLVKENSSLILNYDSPDIKYYSTEAIVKVYLKEVFLLNKALFDILLIKEDQINFLKIEKDNLYTHFKLFSLEEKIINLIAEKLKLNIELADF